MNCQLYDSAGIAFSPGAWCGSTSVITFQPYNEWGPSSSKSNSPFILKCTDSREPNAVIISNPFGASTANS